MEQQQKQPVVPPAQVETYKPEDTVSVSQCVRIAVGGCVIELRHPQAIANPLAVFDAVMPKLRAKLNEEVVIKPLRELVMQQQEKLDELDPPITAQDRFNQLEQVAEIKVGKAKTKKHKEAIAARIDIISAELAADEPNNEKIDELLTALEIEWEKDIEELGKIIEAAQKEQEALVKELAPTNGQK